MKEKRKIWNRKLYWEGIRQLKMIGIMSFVILTIVAILVPLGIQISRANEVLSQTMTGAAYSVSRTVINGKIYTEGYYGIDNLLELNGLLPAVFLLVTPLMVLFLFAFMNKRNASDFYHAIPDRRMTVYISYSAAILTWIVAITVSTSLITWISTLFMEYVTLNITSIFVTILTVLAGCVFVLGAFLIAMSLSGTTFTNIVLAMMIVLVPRMLITIVVYTLSRLLPFVSFRVTGNLLDDRINVVTNIFSGYLIHGNADGLSQVSSGIYTLVIGILYLVIGCIVFTKRKSEVATCAAMNKKVQSVFRVIPAFLVCMMSCTKIVQMVMDAYRSTEYDINAENIFQIIVWYIIAVIVYFLYELITTRKWRNLVHAIPGLGVLLLLNLLYIGGLFGTAYITSHDTPAAERIQSVRVYDLFQDDYFTDKTKAIPITSERVKEVVSQQLQYTAGLWTAKDYGYNEYYMARSQEYSTNITVAIDLGFRTIYRNIIMSAVDMDVFVEELYQNEQFIEAMYQFPQLGSNQTRVEINYGELTQEQTEQLYRIYIEEIRSISSEAYYDLILKRDYDELFHFYVDTAVGMKNYTIPFAVTRNTPKTLTAYLELCNAEAERNLVQDFLADAVLTENQHNPIYADCQLNCTAFVQNGEQYYASAYFSMRAGGQSKDYTENGLKLLTGIGDKLEASKKGIPNIDGILLRVYYSKNSTDAYENETAVRWYEIDAETLDLLRQYNGELRQY